MSKGTVCRESFALSTPAFVGYWDPHLDLQINLHPAVWLERPSLGSHFCYCGEHWKLPGERVPVPALAHSLSHYCLLLPSEGLASALVKETPIHISERTLDVYRGLLSIFVSVSPFLCCLGSSDQVLHTESELGSLTSRT